MTTQKVHVRTHENASEVASNDGEQAERKSAQDEDSMGDLGKKH